MKTQNFFKTLAVTILSTAALSFVACDKGGNGPGPGPGPGKTDPSTIAADNLIAHWAFEDNGNDAKGLTPSKTGTAVSYVTGRRGKAYQGAKDAYLLYDIPASHKIHAVKEFTFAGWFNFKLNPATSDDTNAPEGMIFQVDGETDWVWGNLTFTHQRRPKDGEKFLGIAPMKAIFYKSNGDPNKIQFAENVRVTDQENKWVHVACIYNSTTSKYDVYVNGMVVTNINGEAKDGITMFQKPEVKEGDVVVTPGVPLGELKFNKAGKLVIGRWMGLLNGGLQPTDAWAADFIGQLDELRLYDKALTAAEVKALYDAEVENIN